MKTKKPTCIELFAGAGGLMLGLEMAGFETVLATEIHQDPCKTLKANFPNTPVLNADIKTLSGKDLLRAANLPSGQQIDLIAGGPPCQGFSNAGFKDPNDPRNTLVGDFIRIIEELQPRVFLMENVVGLKTLHKGKLFERIINKFRQTGYEISYEILHAADYGVPQMRKRLFIVGSKDGRKFNFPQPTHASASEVETNLFKTNLSPYVTAGEAIADLSQIQQGETGTTYKTHPMTDFQRLMRGNNKSLYNHQASKHRKETSDYYGLVPPGGTWLEIPPEKRKKKQGMQRWPIDGLSRTITTEPTDFLHPTLNRIPTIREMARVQTFPDWYEFLGQRTTGNKMRRLGYCAQSQQVGNAVPPLLAKAIGIELLKFL